MKGMNRELQLSKCTDLCYLLARSANQMLYMYNFMLHMSIYMFTVHVGLLLLLFLSFFFAEVINVYLRLFVFASVRQGTIIVF